MDETKTGESGIKRLEWLRASVVSKPGFIDQAEALETLRKFVNTPSVTGDEMAFALLVAEGLKAAGADVVKVVEAEPGRPIVWSLTRGGTGPSTMLAGHLDTVNEGDWREVWKDDKREDPYGGTLVNGAMWGRGVADMKGGIAASLAALGTFHREGVRPHGDVLTLWVADEESGEPDTGLSVGMRTAIDLIEAGEIPRPDFAVYLEPTNLAVYASQIGFVIAEIEITGRSAYFAYPEQGVDALGAGVRAYMALDDLNRAMVEKGAHPMVGPRRNLVMGMNAGGAVPKVPDSCVMWAIRSVVPGEDLGDVADEIGATVAEALKETEATFTVTYTASRDHEVGGTPSETDPNTPGIQGLLSAVRAIAPGRANISGAPYWSEMPFFRDLGIPCVYFGAGNILDCHTAQEHLFVNEFDESIAALVLFLAGKGVRM